LLTLCLPFAYSIFHIIIAEITQTDLNATVILLGQSPMYLPLLPFFFPSLKQWETVLVMMSMMLSLSIYSKTIMQGIGETCHYLHMPHFWSIPKFLDKQETKKDNIKTTKSS